MTFASRDDICGWGDGISTNYSIRNRSNNKGNWSNRSDDVDYDDECMAGPARVVLTLNDGKVEKVRSYVGGRWRPSSDAKDLGTVPVREAVDYLLAVANQDNGKGSGEAIFATTLADSVDVSPRLAAIAENESKSDELRGQAIFWLGQSRTVDSGPLLRRLYKTIRDEDVKDKVIFSISQQNDEDSQNWLVDIASNPNESIENRKKALFWAGQTRTPIARLTSMYDKTREREMKDQMIFVFSQRREPAALDKMMDIAKNDPDREARRKAMFWLGQSHDPRVSAFLSDIINR
jgi:HEAT repeat protein